MTLEELKAEEKRLALGIQQAHRMAFHYEHKVQETIKMLNEAVNQRDAIVEQIKNMEEQNENTL